MSTARKIDQARPPNAEHYEVVVVGNLPLDLSNRISGLHAESILRQAYEPAAEYADEQGIKDNT